MTFVYTPINQYRAAASSDRCRAAVHEEVGVGFHQCQRKPIVVRCVDGKEYGFCKQHDPEAVAARRKASHDRWKRERDEDRAKEQRRADLAKANIAAKSALEQIAAGHNDPRALAAEILAMFPGEPASTPSRAEGA